MACADVDEGRREGMTSTERDELDDRRENWAADGGVFTFGPIPFLGSTGDIQLSSPVLDAIN